MPRLFFFCRQLSKQMLLKQDAASKGNLYYRLVALWVISEGLVGGIIHGFHLPFSGIFLSGFAVVCICLIGYCAYAGDEKQAIYSSKNGASLSRGVVFKATILVCIFKMMLSPQSPPTAYFAVLFQGIVGQLLFLNIKRFKVSCILLGFLALVESAIQRILVLVVLYGAGFWQSVNEFITKLTHQNEISNYTLFLALGYVILHGILGVLIGIWSARLIPKSQEAVQEEFLIAPLDVNTDFVAGPVRRKKWKMLKSFIFLAWLFLMVLFFQSLFKIGKPILPTYKVLHVLLRSVLIFLTWYFLIVPLLLRYIKRQLLVQRQKASGDIARIFVLLPTIENIFRESWRLSAKYSGVKRGRLFWKIVLLNVLRDA